MFEFQDFMWKPAANRHIVNDSTPTGFIRAKEQWWVQDQPEIMAALQGWLDKGWEPEAAPGPDCFEISVQKQPVIKTRRGWILFILFAIVCLGIPLILQLIFGFEDEIHYASAFRLKLRRSPAHPPEFPDVLTT